MKSYILISFSFLLLAGCKKENSHDNAGENLVLDLAYDPNYMYPLGFYQDPVSEGETYYENTKSIKPFIERDNIWIELSTNDKGQALNWVKASNDYSSDNLKLLSTTETEKYFEFKTQDTIYTNIVIFSRVHKVDYFQPTYDKSKRLDTAGFYNGSLTSEKIQELIEYLWQNGCFGLWHSKVVKSEIKEYSDYYEQYIQSINIIPGIWGINDVIEVYDNNFKLFKNTRVLKGSTNQTATIVAH